MNSEANCVEIRCSNINGSGIFAARNINQNEKLFIVEGSLRFAEYSIDEAILYPNDLAVDQNVWITPFDNNPWRFVNHCCEPNIYVSGRVTVAAMRDILPGEELLIDYATVEASPFWSMPCGCKAKACRGIVRGYPKLEPELQATYFNYLPEFLQREYLSSGHPPSENLVQSIPSKVLVQG